MNEKTLDLGNGFEIVISGDYEKHFNYEHGIVETWGTDGKSKLFVRRKK